jgi:polar amino acid transport system permease protein/polar amino acid transport system substrate-binding protein
VEETPLNISIFEQWWQAIEPAVNANTLNFWQFIYKEIYLNVIKGDRWMQYLKGLGVTLEVSFYAILVGLALGTILAILRLPQIQHMHARGKGFLPGAGSFVVRMLSKFAGLYINIMRGTPLLLQVLIINFGIFGSVRIDKVIVGVIACGLNSAAYVAEIVRGGIMSIDNGQFEAGRSLGFNYVQTMRFIVIPQVIKNVLPSLANEFIALLKETSVAGYVAVQDLTKGGDIIRSQTYDAFLPLFAVAAIYLAMVMLLSHLLKKLELRLKKNER